MAQAVRVLRTRMAAGADMEQMEPLLAELGAGRVDLLMEVCRSTKCSQAQTGDVPVNM